MTDTTTDVDQRTEFTAGLRALADWYDEHPDFRLPYCSVSLWVYPVEFAAAVKQLGGSRTKSGSTDAFARVARPFGGGVELSLATDRDAVCERVEVGTRLVKRDITEVVGIETVEEPVYEWRCAPVLSGVEAE